MSYQVLARKWRPQLFEEIVGQNHVTRTLKNAVSLNRVAHAYLFAGPRGTGKTSTARILAKALNCERGPTPSPCNECSNCLEIARSESLDVLEIDGASNRGINEIRELRGRVDFSPSRGRYKVYIIDEVHMLTHPAFNALLKTLEEPPHHVIFIFATTDPEKVPPTIISRCHRFNFRGIGVFDIVSRLNQIVEKEKINITSEALQLIAQAAENSMRDAEKILDQLTSYARGQITQEGVTQVLGMVEAVYLAEFTKNLHRRDALSSVKLVHRLLAEGKSPQWIIKGWLNWLRDLLILKLGEKDDFVSFFSHEEELKKQTAYFTLEELTDFIERLIDVERKIRFSSTPQIHLEILMIRLSSEAGEVEKIEKNDPHLALVYRKILNLEKKMVEKSEGEENQNITFSENKPEEPANKDDIPEPALVDSSEDEEESTNETPGEENFPSQGKYEEWQDKWHKVVRGVKERRPSLGTFLEKMEILSIEEDSIILGSRVKYIKEILEKRENQKLIKKESKKHFPLELSLKFKSVSSPGRKKREISESFREVVAQAIEIFEGEVVSERGRR